MSENSIDSQISIKIETDYSDPNEKPVQDIKFSVKIPKLKSLSENKQEFTCNVCFKSFALKRSLVAHYLTHTDTKPHLCDVCDKRFTQNCSLQTHMLIHKGIRPHTCDICNKSFTDKSTWRKHCLIHSGKKPHVCDVCNKGFVEKSALIKHSFIHTDKKPHTCNVCSKGFIKICALKVHLLSHVVKNPIECSVCRNTFPNKGQFQRHFMAQKQSLNYVCNICQKTFKNCRFLKSHQDLHASDHFYYNCNQGYESLIKMQSHVLNCETNLSTYFCSICNEEFGNAETFKEHISVHYISPESQPSKQTSALKTEPISPRN